MYYLFTDERLKLATVAILRSQMKKAVSATFLAAFWNDLEE